MGFEYSARFDDPAWYRQNRSRVIAKVSSVPSFVGAQGPTQQELWLRDASSTHAWPYDVRVFAMTDRLEVEVSLRSPAFTRDVKAIIAWIATQTPVVLIDDDKDVVVF